VPFYYFKSYEALIPGFVRTRNARKPEFFHWIQRDGNRLLIVPGKEDHPVVDVTWFGAEAYARSLGRALPSEAQWEMAARGKPARRYPWGENVPTLYHANLNQTLGRELLPVGFFSPVGDTPEGVADMFSGCFEWTNDWFNMNYYADNATSDVFRNPPGPFWGRSHTIRGFPNALHFPQVSIERIEPVSTRYSWRFEFFVGDLFGNRETTFRTVIPSGRRDAKTGP
jgi:formylglycine-generating enzyme required for sulfatase activity